MKRLAPNQFCPVKEVKRIGLNPEICYNGFVDNTL
jgi:hypothetical protein